MYLERSLLPTCNKQSHGYTVKRPTLELIMQRSARRVVQSAQSHSPSSSTPCLLPQHHVQLSHALTAQCTCKVGMDTTPLASRLEYISKTSAGGGELLNLSVFSL
jgi:hypothetical protein